jgi:hypothetical protein
VASASPSPAVSAPAPSPAFAVHPPPGDRPLFWLEASHSLTELRLLAFDWSGAEVGAIAPRCLAPCSFAPSPDGQRLLLAAQAEPAPAEIIDSAGTHVGSVSDSLGMTWSGDSRHLCVAGAPGAAAVNPAIDHVEVDIVDPATATRRLVASVPWVATAPLLEPIIVRVSCHPAADRAVVTLWGVPGLRGMRVIELSTGRVVYSRDDTPPGSRCGCPVNFIFVSGDGSRIAENLDSGARLRDLSNGTVVPWIGSQPPERFVTGLSWRGGLAAASNGVTAIGLVDLVTSVLVWKAPPLTQIEVVTADPGSDEVLLRVSSTMPDPLSSTYTIVRANGTVREVSSGAG